MMRLSWGVTSTISALVLLNVHAFEVQRPEDNLPLADASIGGRPLMRRALEDETGRPDEGNSIGPVHEQGDGPAALSQRVGKRGKRTTQTTEAKLSGNSKNKDNSGTTSSGCDHKMCEGYGKCGGCKSCKWEECKASGTCDQCDLFEGRRQRCPLCGYDLGGLIYPTVNKYITVPYTAWGMCNDLYWQGLKDDGIQEGFCHFFQDAGKAKCGCLAAAEGGKTYSEWTATPEYAEEQAKKKKIEDVLKNYDQFKHLFPR